MTALDFLHACKNIHFMRTYEIPFEIKKLQNGTNTCQTNTLGQCSSFMFWYGITFLESHAFPVLVQVIFA